MCSIEKSLIGRAHTFMDDQRTKLSDKLGIAALRDPISEAINGTSRSVYGKPAKAKSSLAIPTTRATSTQTGLQIKQ